MERTNWHMVRVIVTRRKASCSRIFAMLGSISVMVLLAFSPRSPLISPVLLTDVQETWNRQRVQEFNISSPPTSGGHKSSNPTEAPLQVNLRCYDASQRSSTFNRIRLGETRYTSGQDIDDVSVFVAPSGNTSCGLYI